MKKLLLGAVIAASLLGFSSQASATREEPKQETYICHDGETTKVNQVERYVHLKYHEGDYDGECEQPTTTTTTTIPVIITIPPTIDPCVVNPSFCPTTTPETTVPPTTEPEPADDGSDDPEPTTTVVVDTTAPPPVVTTTPPPPPTPTPQSAPRLPDTGNETWIIALMGGLVLAAGVGLTAISRRS